jgi:sporulation protein YlmC with PRC-barrel domain
MTPDNGTLTLARLSDGDHVLCDPAEDIRGRHVVDPHNVDLGEVDDLLIDAEEGRVRILRVERGGILGVGATASFIPVDAITSIDDDAVHVGASRERVFAAPRFDNPGQTDADTYAEQLYQHYGYTPFRDPGYTYPPYPFRRR